MNRSASSRWNFWCFLLNFQRYSLTLSLSVVLLFDSAGATPLSTGLQIGQQSGTTQQNPNRAAAKQAEQEGFDLYKQGTAESLRKAIVKWKEALQLWQQLNDKPKQAVTLNNLGRVYDDLGEKQKALDYFNQALPLERAVGDKSREAVTLNNLGKVYNALGEKQKALDYYNQALPLERAVGDKSGEATTLNNLGKVYDDLGEKQKALDYYNQALPLERTVGDKSGEAATLNNLGRVYNALGEKQKALDYYNQALPLERTVGDKSREAATLNNLGLVYSDLGEKQKALDYYNQALPLERTVGDKSGEAATLNNLGRVYNALGEKQKALDYYNQALPLERAVGNKSGEAVTLNNLGLVYDALGEKQKALDYYNQALPLKRAVGDKSGEAVTLNNLGKVYSDLGERQKALDYYNQALPLIRAVGDKSREAVTLNNLGKVYSDLGEKQKALDYFNQALPLERAVGDKSGEALTLGNIAEVERNLGNFEQSLKQIQAAIKIIEDLRTKIDNSDLRISYFASVQNSYKFYIDILMQLHKKNPSMGYNIEALSASERSRARVLLELLTEARADIRKGASPELLAQEKRLTAQIDALEKLRFEIVNSNKINEPGSKAAADKLTKQMSQYRDLYRQLQDKIKKSNPKYASLRYPEPLTLPQIQQQLDKDTLLLEYSLGKEHSYLWAVSSNSVDTYELPKQLKIEKAAINLFCLTSHSTSKPPSATGGTRTEAESVLKLVPLSNRLQVFNFDANYTWATSSALNQFRILHFATHGFVNDENPELSGIVLSLVNKQGKDIQGYLRLNELFNLDYPADLIVLSACETGLGKTIQGEGLVGLTRGLMYAGGERLVVSLWKVEDKATSILMQEFYKEMLLNGKSPNVALRAAQLKMWQQETWRDPNYWAAFTFLGEWH